MISRFRLPRRAATVALAAALTLVPAAAATAATTASGSASSAASGTFTQVFAAYFDGSTVDRRFWSVYDNPNTSKAHLAANVVTHNGYVSLETRYSTSLHKWTTAGMCLCNSASLKRTYGEWDMRARVSSGDSRAVALLWPSVGWPPEIDFMEMGGFSTQGSRRLNTMTVHYGSQSQNFMVHSSESGDFTTWHTFGVRWTPSSVQYLLDGKVTRTVTSGVPRQQMWFGAQTAPERSAQPTKPVNFDIDWFKEYAYNG